MMGYSKIRLPRGSFKNPSQRTQVYQVLDKELPPDQYHGILSWVSTWTERASEPQHDRAIYAQQILKKIKTILEPRLYSIFIRHFFQEETLTSIAKDIGLAMNNVRIKYEKALDKIREEFLGAEYDYTLFATYEGRYCRQYRRSPEKRIEQEALADQLEQRKIPIAPFAFEAMSTLPYRNENQQGRDQWRQIACRFYAETPSILIEVLNYLDYLDINFPVAETAQVDTSVGTSPEIPSGTGQVTPFIFH